MTDYMRDATAAAMARDWARETTEHGCSILSDDEIRARLEEEAVDEEVTGWAQEAAIKAYRAAVSAR